MSLVTISLVSRGLNAALAQTVTPYSPTQGEEPRLQPGPSAHPNPARAELQGQIYPSPPFQDVPSNAWAFEALLNLVNTYGCIAGYPDGTYRGNQAVTRYEFTAAMNACMDVFSRLVQQQQTQQEQEIQEFVETLRQMQTELDSLQDEPAANDDMKTPN